MKKKAINFGLIAAGTVFLFNPKLAVIDVLPDFIGYLLIMAGIDRASMLNPQFEKAKSGFMRLIYISLAEFAFVLFIFGVAGSGERSSLMLIGAFCVGLFECIFMFPAWNDFFNGFFYLGFENGTAKNGRVRDEIGSICKFTKIFWVYRAANVLMPELSVLTVTKGSDNLYEFIGFLRIIAITAGAAVGLVWLARILGFLRRASRQSFVSAASERFTAEVLPNKGIFIRRTVRIAFALICIGFLLGIDVISNGISLTPDIFGALSVIAGLLILRKYAEHCVRAIAAVCVWGAASAAYWIVNYLYLGNYTEYFAATRSEDAYTAYITVEVTGIAEACAFAVAVLAVISVLHFCVTEHAGYSMKMQNGHGEDKINEIRRSLNLGLIFTAAAAVLCTLCGIIYVITQPFAEGTFYEVIPVLKSGAEILFAAVAWISVMNIRREIEYKYMLS